MKTSCNPEGVRLHFLFTCVLLLLVISGCSFNVTRYTDGPLTQYLTEPVPTLNKPIARTLSVEKIMYNTAGSMKAIMISDLVTREIYLMPDEVGIEVKVKRQPMLDSIPSPGTERRPGTCGRVRQKVLR